MPGGSLHLSNSRIFSKKGLFPFIFHIKKLLLQKISVTDMAQETQLSDVSALLQSVSVQKLLIREPDKYSEKLAVLYGSL